MRAATQRLNHSASPPVRRAGTWGWCCVGLALAARHTQLRMQLCMGHAPSHTALMATQRPLPRPTWEVSRNTGMVLRGSWKRLTSACLLSALAMLPSMRQYFRLRP